MWKTGTLLTILKLDVDCFVHHIIQLNLYLLLLKCWSDHPKKRPIFNELANGIKEIINRLGEKRKYDKLNLNNSYVNLSVDILYYNYIDAIKQ